MIIKDPEVAKLFADDTRRHILHILRRDEHSTTELAKALDKSHSSIIHHLNLLREAGLVEETRTEKVRNMVVSYYRSTAPRFMISYSLSEALNQEGDTAPWQEATLQAAMDGLESFGISLSDEKMDEARKLISTFFLRDQKAFEETLELQQEPIKTKRPRRYPVITLLKQITLSEDPEYLEVLRELKEILRPSDPSAGGDGE
ncbi:MAG: ArsR family transcriptional regulator [Candidatus Bathyarchaeota archaeon]|nr:ArsR family transcriptional regulator [Candidatus Bathyarchaeota archaeon]